MLLKVAWNSLRSRATMVALTVLTIAVSVFVMLGVEHIRQETRQSFSKTVSGVDLIVGARTSQLNLLLYSVFRIGNPTNNISWKSYQALSQQKQVKWSIPISLGDSHRGYRVMGTSAAYFEHFRYGNQRPLQMQHGQPFAKVHDAVLGAEVAKALGYKLGDEIILSHGIGKVSFSNHDDQPFTIVGILEPTATPVDQTVHVSLAGIEAIHLGWESGVKLPGRQPHSRSLNEAQLTPTSITAFMVGLHSKIATFGFQRQVNDYRQEPLSAILPGAALAELWQTLRGVEGVLLLISGLVLMAALLGMSTMLLASMQARKKEMAIMRAMGAHSRFIVLLIQVEAVLITLLGIAVGLAALWVCLFLAQDSISSHYGLFISLNFVAGQAWAYLLAIVGAAALLGLLPAILAYRYSLTKSLQQI